MTNISAKLIVGDNTHNIRVDGYDIDFMGNIKLRGKITGIGESDIYITRVIFNDPATIVYWSDGSKTVVRCGERDTFDKEKGLAMAVIKRMCGNDGSYNSIFKEFIDED